MTQEMGELLLTTSHGGTDNKEKLEKLEKLGTDHDISHGLSTLKKIQGQTRRTPRFFLRHTP